MPSMTAQQPTLSQPYARNNILASLGIFLSYLWRLTIMTNLISRTKLESRIRSLHGMFGVTFTKQNGDSRRMLCVIPIPLKDPKRRSNAREDNSYILVQDLVQYRTVLKADSRSEAYKQSYRLINLATITELRCKGQTFRITK